MGILELKYKSFVKEDPSYMAERLTMISQLFGFNIILDMIRGASCRAKIDENRIEIGRDLLEEFSFEAIDSMVNENIDGFNNEEHEELYKKCPFVIKTLLHEISHLITMSVKNGDMDRYDFELEELEMKCISQEITYEEFDQKYRQLPYEKLADNLASELYYHNYYVIDRILSDKKVFITDEIIEDNLLLSHIIKQKYIK